MELINKAFAELTREDFDNTISGLTALMLFIPTTMIKNGGSVDDAAIAGLDLQIAVDAVTEIKEQLLLEIKA